MVPERHRGVVAIAAGVGLRWGEAAGVCADALDLDRAQVRVVRTVIGTVIEVAGHTSFKPFPKSAAGQRTVPLPAWLVTILREHLARHELGAGDLVFTNAVGGALRRTLFRSRIWRPALVRAGQLGTLTRAGDAWVASWTDSTTQRHRQVFDTETAAVDHVARHQDGGLRFHDLRHSYATWVVDDGCRPTWSSGSWATSARRRRWTSTRGAPTTRPASCAPSTTRTPTTDRRGRRCPRDALLLPHAARE